jgi:hypothetical protein
MIRGIRLDGEPDIVPLGEKLVLGEVIEAMNAEQLQMAIDRRQVLLKELLGNLYPRVLLAEIMALEKRKREMT